MNHSPIDDYVDQVSRHLKLRGAARQQALDDLREALAEASDAVDDALGFAGRATDYAASLDEQFGTTEGAFRTIAGMPNSFTRGIGRRMAGTFNPTDERLLVPRVLGAGWTLNMGAVAVRLGLLRPDDIDDEVLDAAANDHLATSQLVASGPIALAAAAAILLWRRRHAVARLTGRNQGVNLAFGALIPLAAAALLSASVNPQIPSGQRLTMPALAATLGLLAAGSSTQLAYRPKGQSIVLASLLLAAPLNLALSYLPVRSALRDDWSAQPHHEQEAPDA